MSTALQHRGPSAVAARRSSYRRFPEPVEAKVRTQPNQRDLLVLRMCRGSHGPRDERRHGVRVPLGTQHINLKEFLRRRSGDDGKLGCGQALRRVGLAREETRAAEALQTLSHPVARPLSLHTRQGTLSSMSRRKLT